MIKDKGSSQATFVNTMRNIQRKNVTFSTGSKNKKVIDGTEIKQNIKDDIEAIKNEKRMIEDICNKDFF